jgi:hypothetical protein
MKLLNTIKILSFQLLALCSCTSDSDKAKISASNQFNNWRDRIQLKRLDETLQCDSVLYFLRESGVCDYCGGVKSLPEEFGNSYRVREFYKSGDPTLKNFRKEVIWNVDSGKYVLVQEQDIYRKFDQGGFDVDLHIAIGPVWRSEFRYRTFLEVDTIPRPETLRMAEVKAGIEPKAGYYVCGTAYNEFLEEYLPERHVALDTNMIGQYLKEFLQLNYR